MAIDLSSMDYPQTTLAAISKPVSQSDGTAQEFPLDAIDEDPDQPRKEFDQAKLEDLAASIKESGVLQPITIKPHPTDPRRYLIRYGARRYRASILAGKATIPAFIAEQGDDYTQVIENLQRDDLTLLEIAKFIQKRLDAGDSKVDIAKRLGKRKEFVTFHLALVDPPPFIEALITEGKARNVQRLYQLRNLHAKHPEAVEAWCNEQAELSPQAIDQLANELGGKHKKPTGEQEAPHDHSAGADGNAKNFVRTKSGHGGEDFVMTKSGKGGSRGAGDKEPKPKTETIPFPRSEGTKRLALDVPATFIALAEARGLAPEQVLAAFMADLAHTGDSNGSDERQLADAWFDRVLWPEPANEAAVG